MKNEKTLLIGKAAHVCRFTSEEGKFIDDAPDLTIYFIVDSNILIPLIPGSSQKQLQRASAPLITNTSAPLPARLFSPNSFCLS